MKRIYWTIIPLLFFATLLVFFWRGLSLKPQELPSAQIGKQLPSFKIPQLLGDKTMNAKDLIGHVFLLNVWASWCAACTDEQNFLLQLARDGLIIYGLNYKDSSADARRWLSIWGNPYRMVGEDLNGKVAIDLGVYGAPETFLIDACGIIQHRHAGPLSMDVWQREFAPRIIRLKQKNA